MKRWRFHNNQRNAEPPLTPVLLNPHARSCLNNSGGNQMCLVGGAGRGFSVSVATSLVLREELHPGQWMFLYQECICREIIHNINRNQQCPMSCFVLATVINVGHSISSDSEGLAPVMALSPNPEQRSNRWWLSGQILVQWQSREWNKGLYFGGQPWRRYKVRTSLLSDTYSSLSRVTLQRLKF